MPDLSAEMLRSDLTTAACRLFGAERAAALEAELTALAADLARVAEAPLPDETEPGFFSLDGGDAS